MGSKRAVKLQVPFTFFAATTEAFLFWPKASGFEAITHFSASPSASRHPDV